MVGRSNVPQTQVNTVRGNKLFFPRQEKKEQMGVTEKGRGG